LPVDVESWKGLLIDAFRLAREAIEAEATVRDVSVQDLATTLILLVATPELVAGAQVGDGAIVVGDGQGDMIALTTPQHGEHINETIFLTSSDALDTVQVRVRRTTSAQIAMFSDGLEMLSLEMPAGTPHRPFFLPLFRFATEMADEKEATQQLESFLTSSRMTDRSDDDLTLLLATRTRS